MSTERHSARPRLGAYELLRPLARGGMAELFVVRTVGPEGFEKVLVLKRVLPHLAEDQRFVRAFLDEARLVAGFAHPNIASVYEMGSCDGSYYFTMELVRGVDVRAILQRCKRQGTTLPVEHALIIARDVASALHYAHERRGGDGSPLGLVHRDVSPSNIIVSFEGAPKLIDFGIAKATATTTKTQTGSLKGKVAYMAPEQARGAALDRRTDVFALGVILWEMLAGKRLFKGDNDLATLQRIIYEPAPDLREARPDCPEALARIVARALAPAPADRPQTAQELQLELEELAHALNLKLSTFALGAYLREQFAAEVREAEELGEGTATAVTAAADEADELEAFERPTVALGAQAAAPAIATPASELAAPVAAVAQDVIEAPERASAPRRRWPWALAGATAVAAAIAVVVVRGGESPAAASATAPAVAASATAPSVAASATAPSVETSATVSPASSGASAPVPSPASAPVPSVTAAARVPSSAASAPPPSSAAPATVPSVAASASAAPSPTIAAAPPRRAPALHATAAKPRAPIASPSAAHVARTSRPAPAPAHAGTSRPAPTASHAEPRADATPPAAPAKKQPFDPNSVFPP